MWKPAEGGDEGAKGCYFLKLSLIPGPRQSNNDPFYDAVVSFSVAYVGQKGHLWGRSTHEAVARISVLVVSSTVSPPNPSFGEHPSG